MNIVGWVHLIKMHIYMMTNLISIVYHDRPLATISFAETYTIKSMARLFPLAPHHDSLQYIHHVRLMQRGQNRGVTHIS